MESKRGRKHNKAGKECLQEVEFLHIIALWSIFRCFGHCNSVFGQKPCRPLLPHHGISRIDLMMQLDDAKWCYVICIHCIRVVIVYLTLNVSPTKYRMYESTNPTNKEHPSCHPDHGVRFLTRGDQWLAQNVDKPSILPSNFIHLTSPVLTTLTLLCRSFVLFS